MPVFLLQLALRNVSWDILLRVKDHRKQLCFAKGGVTIGWQMEGSKCWTRAQPEDLRVGRDPATGTLGLEDGCLEEERSVTILESGDRG